jgi:hypothetical protein
LCSADIAEGFTNFVEVGLDAGITCVFTPMAYLIVDSPE